MDLYIFLITEVGNIRVFFCCFFLCNSDIQITAILSACTTLKPCWCVIYNLILVNIALIGHLYIELSF